MTTTSDMLDAVLARPARRDDLMRRYLRGQLEEPLLEALEIRLLEDPALLAEFEAEQELRDALRALEPSAVASASTATGRRRSTPALASAAGLALAALLGALLPALGWWQARRGADVAAGPVPVLTLHPQRGSTVGVEVVTLDPSAARFVLRVPAPNRPGLQRLRLIEDASDRVVVESDAAADDEGWTYLLLERAQIEPGRYRLQWNDAPPAILELRHASRR